MMAAPASAHARMSLAISSGVIGTWEFSSRVVASFNPTSMITGFMVSLKVTHHFGSGVVDSLELVDLFAKIEESLGAQLSFEDLDFDQLTDIGSTVAEITRILR